MDKYTSHVISASVDTLTAKDRIRLKNFGTAHALDEIVTEDAPAVIDLAFYAMVAVHNPKSKDKQDYEKCVLVDNAGEMYVTGSETFARQLEDIAGEMNGEPFSIEVFKKPSKNYKGKYFMTCNII